MTRPAGIVTLADLSARCEVDAATGCWLWPNAGTGSLPPNAWYRRPDTLRLVCAPVRRAGVHLQRGGVLAREAEVFAAAHCTQRDCCNPAHALVATRPERVRHQAERAQALAWRQDLAAARWRHSSVFRLAADAPAIPTPTR